MKQVVNFTRYRIFAAILSLSLIAGGMAGLFLHGGFNLGIDFKPGLSQRVVIDSNDITVENLRQTLAPFGAVQIQTVGAESNHEFVIKIEDSGEVENFVTATVEELRQILTDRYGSVEIRQSDYVSGRFSQNLGRQTFSLTAIALAAILVYVWFRFKLGYALSAISALIHDVLIMLGFIGTMQLEVSTATIAAVLTIIGYSLNDTIVIFDRVRENERILQDRDLEKVINTSITQSLSRTLITSLTTLLAVAAIFIFGTGQIKDFALNLMIGIIVGTYSSIFVASPIYIAWSKARRKRAVGRKAEAPAAKGTAAKTTKASDEAAPAPQKTEKVDIPHIERKPPKKKKKK